MRRLYIMLLCAGAAMAAGPPKITYDGGQLRIEGNDLTLADVLARVAAVIGVKIDVPPGAGVERMPVVELGPGPARQVLASLLSDSDFDYLIQDSGTDPEKIQNVLVMLKDKSSGAADVMEAARPRLGPRALPAAPEPASPAPPEEPVVEARFEDPRPEKSTLPVQSGPLRPGALSPPASLDMQSMTNQLQQMYAQRIQMTQEARQAGK